MPSQQNLDQVEELVEKLQSAKSAALFQYQGLSADEINTLRANVKEKGGAVGVFKNTLLTIALQKLGIKLPEKLTGPTALAVSTEDEIAPLKAISDFAKDKEATTFKYGIYQLQLLPVDQLKQLLSLPSRTTLISQFVGGLANPLQRLVYALKYNQTRLALVLKAIADKQPAAQ